MLRHRYKVLLAVLLLVAVSTLGLGKLGFKSDFRIWFDADDPAVVTYDRFREEFGNDDQFVIAFKDPGGIYNATAVRTIQRLTEAVWRIDGIVRVDSVSNYQAIRGDSDQLTVDPLFPPDEPVTEERLRHAREYQQFDPLMSGYVVTDDAKVAYIRGRFGAAADSDNLPVESLEAVRGIMDEAASRSGYRFHVAGGPITDAAFDQAAKSDMANLMPLLLLVCLVALGVVFRSLWAMAVPLIVAIAAIIVTLGAAGALGTQLNAVTTLVPQIMLALAVAASLHLLAAFFAGRRAGVTTNTAVVEAVATRLRPLFFTSLTTALAFLSFAAADIVPIQSLGLMAAAGVLAIFVLEVTLLPLLLSFYPQRRVPRRGLLEMSGDGFGRLAQKLQGRAAIIVAFWAIVALAAIASVPKLQVESDPIGYFADDHWFSEAIDFIEESGSGAAMYEIVVRAQGVDSIKTVEYMRDLDRFADYLRNEAPGGINAVYDAATIIKNANRAWHNDDPAKNVIPERNERIAEMLFLYSLSVPQGKNVNDRINIEGTATRVTVTRELVSSRESQRNIDRIERWAESHLDHANVQFTGKDVLYTKMGNDVTSSLARSLLIAVIGVTIIIAGLFRSLRMAAISVAANVVPLGAALSVMAWLDIPLDVGTAMVAALGLGIAVDDTIHFLAHYTTGRRLGVDSVTAVKQAMKAVGPAITATTVVLICAFGVFGFADFLPNAYFGLLLSVVLASALVLDLSLLPTLLARFDRGEDGVGTTLDTSAAGTSGQSHAT